MGGGAIPNSVAKAPRESSTNAIALVWAESVAAHVVSIAKQVVVSHGNS